jgi:hypothetical protein
MDVFIDWLIGAAAWLIGAAILILGCTIELGLSGFLIGIGASLMMYGHFTELVAIHDSVTHDSATSA